MMASALTAPSEKSAACIFASYESITDASKCTSVTLKGPFTVPANKVINFSNLASGTTLTIEGTITFEKGTLDKTNYLLTIGGQNLVIDGTAGTLNGNGPLYWDGQGGNGGVPKPKFIRLSKVSGKLLGLKIVGSPIHTFSIQATNFTIDGVNIDNRGTNYAQGHNTDGFDISGKSNLVTIKNSYVYNNDDCLAVNDGSDIHFTNNYCSGGHGVSIGSIQTGHSVDGVYVSGTTIVNSENGVRIKVYNDATSASVNDVHYDTITLSGITKYGIIIQQDYTNSGATGTPGTKAPTTNIVLNNIKGSMKSGEAEYILCGNCSKFTFTNIAITGATKASSCTGISPKPSGCP